MDQVTRLAALLLLVTITAGAGVACADGLYEVRTIVTGQGEENRAVGFARALEAVLVKASGDPRLIEDPRVRATAGEAGSFVDSFRYRDRLAGIPVQDEQGTRDRPYDLTVSFRPARIDALLRSLGREKWPMPRPRVAVSVWVDNGSARYRLASDGDLGRDQRESLAEAADAIGLPLALPSAATTGIGGDVALAGDLVWSARDLGWVADWRLVAGGRALGWRVSGVNFDDAFRSAVRGAAQVLSGNGEPR